MWFFINNSKATAKVFCISDNVAEMVRFFRQSYPDHFYFTRAQIELVINERVKFSSLYDITECDIYPVMVHGDLWTMNLFFNGDKLRAIGDWQLCHVGEFL